MSKIGKKPIQIPSGVTVKMDDGVLRVSGPKGEITLPVLSTITADQKDNQLVFTTGQKTKQAFANWGTMRALARNAIVGVSEGFKKVLEIEGVGFRASLEGKTLVLNVGFSHPIKYEAPQGVAITAEKNVITVSGVDRQLVGQAAAQIREIKNPEPYKGKGIRYQGEVIRRKAGKKVAK